MTDTGRHAEQDRNVVFFTQIEGILEHFLRFHAVGGFEHQQTRVTRVVAVVLFVLRREHARFVGRDNDRTAVYAQIREREHRVRRDVESDVLHRRHRTDACDGSARRRFKRCLFVGRPFRSDFRIFDDIFEYFGTRGSGICGSELDPGFVRAAGCRFVPGH